jgi:hypothetical protein
MSWNKPDRIPLTLPTNSCTLQLLRWEVAAQLFGMDSRQYGKKFPGCLKENARPSLSISVGLFILIGRCMRTWVMFFLFDIILITAYLLLLMRQKISEVIDNTRSSTTT